jgi:hypothetical protein
MPGLFGGGGSSQPSPTMIPFNAGGTGTGGSVYTPQQQPAFDQYYQDLVRSFIQPYQAGTTAPQVNAPLAESAAMNIAQNPFAASAMASAGSVGNFGTDFLSTLQSLFPQAFQGGQAGAYYGGQAATQGAQAGAGGAGLPGTVAGYGAQTAGLAPLVAGEAANISSLAPYVAGLAPQVAAGIAPLQAGGRSILDTSFDPRQQLYNRLLQQNTEQSNASNAMYGLGSSPYGAGLAQSNLRNFDIDWQNQQLARQAQGLQSAGSAFGQAGALGTGAGNLYRGAGDLYRGAADTYGLTGNLYGQAGTLASMVPNIGLGNLRLGGGAADLASSSASLPYSAIQGAQSLVPGAGTLAQQPYTTSIGQSQAALPALQNASTQGISQYTLPQNILQDLQSYLRLGQSASDLSGTLGQQGFNQQNTQLAGIGNLVGGLLGGSGTGGLGGGASAVGGLLPGLFGGGNRYTPALSSFTADPSLGGFVSDSGALGSDFVGGGAADLGSIGFPAEATGGGGFLSGLASLLPFASIFGA